MLSCFFTSYLAFSICFLYYLALSTSSCTKISTFVLLIDFWALQFIPVPCSLFTQLSNMRYYSLLRSGVCEKTTVRVPTLPDGFFNDVPWQNIAIYIINCVNIYCILMLILTDSSMVILTDSSFNFLAYKHLFSLVWCSKWSEHFATQKKKNSL